MLTRLDVKGTTGCMPMQWEKAPPELIATFDAAFPDDPRAQRRQMFGYPAGFVNGNMFGGVHQRNVVLRLGDSDREQLVQLGAAQFQPMGRPMKGYVTAPEAMLAEPDQLRDWLQRALEFTAGLPAKEAKPKAPRKAR